jgi:hypothetical protein
MIPVRTRLWEWRLGKRLRRISRSLRMRSNSTARRASTTATVLLNGLEASACCTSSVRLELNFPRTALSGCLTPASSGWWKRRLRR